MAPDKARKLTATDLPLDVVREFRVMFRRGGTNNITVVTDQVREGLESELFRRLGFVVHVEHVDHCGDEEAQRAYPVIMAQCEVSGTKAKKITGTQSEAPDPSGRPKKRKAPKPE